MKLNQDLRIIIAVVIIIAVSFTIFGVLVPSSSNWLTGGAVTEELFVEDQVSVSEAYQISQDLGIVVSKEELNDPYLAIKIKNIENAREEHDNMILSKMDSDDVLIDRIDFDSSKGGLVGALNHVPSHNISAVLVNANGDPLNLSFDRTFTYSYADGTTANQNAFVKLCSNSSSNLENYYVTSAYYAGDHYLYTNLFARKITSNEIDGNNCTMQDIDFSSGRSLYPGVQTIVIADNRNFANPEWYHLGSGSGNMVGNYTLDYSQSGNEVTINVTNITDGSNIEILSEFNFLHVGFASADGHNLSFSSSNVTSPRVSSIVTNSPESNLYINGKMFSLTLNSFIDACGLVSGEVFLSQSINSSGTCLTVNSNDTSIDCAGYNITYSESEFGYGINNSGYSNLTVQNCNIFGGLN